uniref:Uncharacterized protein n=1 Tax=Cacopsylla melanoneura TaxID=428564 RepID=A0A8D8X6P6_9HEMI
MSTVDGKVPSLNNTCRLSEILRTSSRCSLVEFNLSDFDFPHSKHIPLIESHVDGNRLIHVIHVEIHMVAAVCPTQLKFPHCPTSHNEYITFTIPCQTVGLTQRKMQEIQSELTDLGCNLFHPDGTFSYIRRRTREARVGEVGDVVSRFLTTRHVPDTADTKSVGTFSVGCSMLNSTVVRIQTESSSPAIVCATFQTNRNRKEVQNWKINQWTF